MNATAGYNDMTSYEFAHSGCAWCHPGGGPLEYDRAGYRYDGDLRGNGLIWGAESNPDVISGSTSTVRGDYYIFDPVTKTIAEPSTVINQGASIPQATTAPTNTVYYKSWVSGGVAEVDCLMCHYANQYANLERAYAFPGAAAPKLAASLGLVGAKGQTGLSHGVTKATYANNPANLTGFIWDFFDITSMIVKTPNRENCSICHFPDKSWWANCAADTWTNYSPTNANCGPAGKPFGATMFQKVIGVGEAVDGDIIAVNSTNTSTWQIAKGRVEGGKRGESLNDSGNPDAHMKTAGSGMSCSVCHYTLSGNFDALTDASGNVIQPALTGVLKIDHQFAKGNNAPDGKNMDQLDNTVTCAGCHIDHTHPGLTLTGGVYTLNSVTVPTPAHAGFPSLHFARIDCKTCHIPSVNGPVKQTVADFTAGPFQTFERTQTLEAPPGVNMKPLFMWRATEHDGTGMQIEPIMTMAVPVWANRVDTAFNPTFQRMAKAAAEKYRELSGNDGTGKYSFTLNTGVSYQGEVFRTAYSSATGTNETFKARGSAFVINTTAEIAGIADIYKNPGAYWGTPPFAGLNGDPVVHFYFNQFALSHNVATKASKNILGAPASGGCKMCHSSSNPASPYYNEQSVGFFDKTFILFDMPTDGLQQTFNLGSTPTTTPRINMKFPARKPDGTSFSIDLANVGEGENVGNTLSQSAVLGYSTDQLVHLMSINPVVPNAPLAKIGYSINNLTVTFDGSTSANAAGFSWNLGDGTTANAATTTHTYAAAGTKTVSLTVTNADGVTDTKTAVLSLMANNTAPTIDAAAITVVNKVATLAFQAVDSDPTDTQLQVFVNWGDGSGSSFGLVSGLTTTTHLYSDGTYTAYLAISDRKGGHAVQSIPVGPISTSMGTITGLISDGTNSIGGAVVTLYTANSTTPVSAVFSVATPTTNPAYGTYALQNIPLGRTYDIKVQKAGYNTAMVEDVVISSATPTSINITMTPVNTGTLFLVSGVITDAPIGTGVQLWKMVSPTIFNPSGMVVAQQDLTDAAGNYRFTNIPAGNYRVIPVPTAGHTDPSSVDITVSGADVLVSGMTYTNP